MNKSITLKGIVMNFKQNIFFLMFFLVCSSYGVYAATITIKNGTADETFDVQVIESREDEYKTGVFNHFSLKPGHTVEHKSSFLKQIMGFRWRKRLFHKTNGSIISIEYFGMLNEPISRLSNNGELVLLPDGLFQYYFDKANKTHYYEDRASKYIYALIKNPDGTYSYKPEATWNVNVENDPDQWNLMQ